MTLPKMLRFSCRFPLGLVIAVVLAVLPALSILGSAPTAGAVQPATPVASAVAPGLRIRDLQGATHRTTRAGRNARRDSRRICGRAAQRRWGDRRAQ